MGHHKNRKKSKFPQPDQGSQTQGISSKTPSLKRFLLNYCSTMFFIIGSYLICTDVSSFHQRMLTASIWVEPFGNRITITIHNVFIGLIILYAIVLIPFYWLQPWLHSKTYIFLRGVFYRLPQKKLLSKDSKQAGLALLLKFFFAPLMINWCLAHIGDMANKVTQVIKSTGFRLTFDHMPFWTIQPSETFRLLFDHSLFWACFQLILFVDTLLFTIGYIIEIPKLNNRIRSVEPTFLGWFVCLMCYPPFNQCTGQFFAWQSTDFPRFQNEYLHFILNIGILILMGIYSWCSVALGLKASNLTNRGIVSSGPYAWVRHPAYTAKNMAWWIGAFPTFYIAFQSGFQAGLYAIVATAGWSFIYAMRAITEERHLLLANNGYSEYKKKVKWRFIPGLI